jgi:hypothetical protein
MKRRIALLALCTAAARVAAQPAKARHRAALHRFEDAMHKEVAAAPGTPAVRWREAAVPPDPHRLLWGERTTRVPGMVPLYRAAFDPATSWYYVTRTVNGRQQYFGPIEEVGEGVYVDAFPAPDEPAPAR